MSKAAISAGRSALWQVVGSVAQFVIRLGASMILARHLLPREFGLFATAYIIYGVFEMLSANGLTAGIITKKKPTRTEISTCFWMVAVLRIILFIIVYNSAGIIAQFMKNPELTPLIRAVSFLILFMAIGTVAQGLMIKDMHFKQITMIKLISGLIESLLAVILVLTTDLRYWALVYAMLISIAFMNILMFMTARFIPHLCFSKKAFRSLAKFGYNGIGASITAYLSHNFDYMIIAKLLGPKSLGYYEFAYRLPHIVNERVSSPIGGVVFSALAQKEKDKREILKSYLNATEYVAWLIFPLLGGLIVTAPMVVKFLWGDRWISIVTPLRILCISAALNGILDYSRSVFLCLERPDIEFKFQILNLIIAIICVSSLGYIMGLNGVAIGMVLSRAAMLLQTNQAMRMLDSTLSLVLRIVTKPLVTTMFMVFFLFFFQMVLWRLELNENLILPVMILIGGITYISAARIMFPTAYEEIVHAFKKNFLPRNLETLT